VRAIFLTGASGVLGQALQKSFADSTLFCLVRRNSVSAPNAVPIFGDIAQPRLGLSRSDYAELTQDTDLVIHAAAVTDFNQPEDVINQTNVDGTRNVVEFAAAAKVPLYYVSTAFSQEFGNAGDFGANAYELSKQAAEVVVRTSGIPSLILRPSIVVGDSSTGAIGRSQGFHFMLKLICKGFFPLGPAAPGSYVDTIPRDVVARIIAALVERGDASGEVWLTLGDRALTVDRLVDLCVEHAPRLTGREIHRPRLVTPDVFDRLIRPVFLPALPDDLRSMLDRALGYAKYFNIREPLPSSLPELESELDIGPVPSPEATLVRNLEYLTSRTARVREGV
jgi:nucleoside-diphosphate-sugar epimerase